MRPPARNDEPTSGHEDRVVRNGSTKVGGVRWAERMRERRFEHLPALGSAQRDDEEFSQIGMPPRPDVVAGAEEHADVGEAPERSTCSANSLARRGCDRRR